MLHKEVMSSDVIPVSVWEREWSEVTGRWRRKCGQSCLWFGQIQEYQSCNTHTMGCRINV